MVSRETYPIGENIRKIREMHKMTQAQFAEVIGKSQSTVYAYERGIIIPPFDVLVMISSMFKVSLGMIMGLESSSTSPASLQEIYNIYLNSIGDEDGKEEE